MITSRNKLLNFLKQFSNILVFKKKIWKKTLRKNDDWLFFSCFPHNIFRLFTVALLTWMWEQLSMSFFYFEKWILYCFCYALVSFQIHIFVIDSVILRRHFLSMYIHTHTYWKYTATVLVSRCFYRHVMFILCKTCCTFYWCCCFYGNLHFD